MINTLRDILSGAWIKRQAEPNDPPPPVPAQPWFGVLIQARHLSPGPIPNEKLRDALHAHLQKPGVAEGITSILATVIHEVRTKHPELSTELAQFQPIFTTVAGDHAPASVDSGYTLRIQQ